MKCYKLLVMIINECTYYILHSGNSDEMHISFHNKLYLQDIINSMLTH